MTTLAVVMYPEVTALLLSRLHLLALNITIGTITPPKSLLSITSNAASFTVRSVSRFQWQLPAKNFVSGVSIFCKVAATRP